MDFRGKHIDLVGRINLWFGISLTVILIGLVSWGLFGLNLGVDFNGGGQWQYRIPAEQRPTAGQDAQLIAGVRDQLEAKDVRGSKIQIAGGDTLVVQTNARGDSELRGQERVINQILATQWKQPVEEIKPLSRELVGPVIGEELRRNAIKGIVLGIFFIAAWICLRYSFNSFQDGIRYAVAGVAALVHDVFVLLGLFALIGHFDPRIEVDGAFIAALLTVVGYSINDSVVIFDRLRENLRIRRRESFDKVVNDSLLETMSRSINTGLTVIIMLFVMLMLGGESIYNFVLAMLVGIAAGLYSSIFNASMVLVAWHHWDEKKAAQARATRSQGGGRVVTSRDVSPTSTTRPTLSGAGRPSLTSQNANDAAASTATNSLSTPVAAIDSKVDAETDVARNGSAAESDTISTPRPPRKARAKRRF